MKRQWIKARIVIFFLIVPGAFSSLWGEVTVEDYKRADFFRKKAAELVAHDAVVPHWIGKTSRFWYRCRVPGGKRFILVDPGEKSRAPAFDHARLAAALSRTTDKSFEADSLPFDSITLDPEKNHLTFEVEGAAWTCSLVDYSLQKGGAAPPEPARAGRRDRRIRSSGETPSPDEKWRAFFHDHNLYLRDAVTGEEFPLSNDGTEEEYYEGPLEWAPDSTRLACYLARRGRETEVYLIESAPDDRMRPRMSRRPYALPGDVLTTSRPCIFTVENRPPVKVRNDLFPNAYRISGIHWDRDSSRFTFRYHERGEQRARVIGVDGRTGKAELIFEEMADTFIDRYNMIVRHVDSTGEIIWSSERDGWRHLYLYDGRTGEMKNRLTRGEWVVRRILHLDEKARRLYFLASGREPGQDPYFTHLYAVGLDGSGLTRLTEGDAHHEVTIAPDRRGFVDASSRVDLPPVSVYRSLEDGAKVMDLETADISALRETGWIPPERFTAKGRDGVTDIHGVIFRPSHFDPEKSYPVIENIYAGPHGSHVPKSFRAVHSGQALTELGFIVVRMDGMGTANRSKAFHDVCWKNLADAGFPDRIAWIRAAAARHPEMDIDRMGIYGTSAGGQNALGALLFQGGFYKAAVSSCGCHDNRMDKAVWNEQWMGWPVGAHYEAQSNAVNAHHLAGKLLLIVGGMDTNVPPQSTFQVADALIRANKDFDLLVLPRAGHTSGGDYGERRRRDFFVRHLLGENPPEWNRLPAPEKDSETPG